MNKHNNKNGKKNNNNANKAAYAIAHRIARWMGRGDGYAINYVGNTDFYPTLIDRRDLSYDIAGEKTKYNRKHTK